MEVEGSVPARVHGWTLGVLLVLFCLGISVLAFRLWRVQVCENVRYDGVKERQSLLWVGATGAFRG